MAKKICESSLPVYEEVEDKARNQFHESRKEEVEEPVAMETGGHHVESEVTEGTGEPVSTVDMLAIVTEVRCFKEQT